MDSSRYKRREIQTRRHITNEYRGPVAARPVRLVDAVIAGLPPLPKAAASPAQPVYAAQPLINPIDQARRPEILAPRPTAPRAAPAVAVDGLPGRRLPISMAVPGGPSPGKAAGVKVLKSKWRLARRWAFRSTAIVMVLVIASGGLIVSQGWLKARKVFKGGTTSAAALQQDVNPSLLKGEGDGRINILLLGRGGGNHDAPDLTDTIMLASIDPVNHTATLLSIPRDMWVSVQGAGSMKINAAWETGKYKFLGKITNDNSNPQATLAGFTTVDQAVESVIGVPIHYNVLVDFDAFKQSIDTVGGVTVNVPEDLVDPTMAWENGRNPVLAKAGTQTFDGTHALMYSRSRETSSDFARGQRQRAVLLALKDKVATLGTLSSPTKLASLANAFGSNVQTDLAINDAARLANIVKDVNNTNVNSIGLADAPNSFVTTANVNGQSVVQPKAGPTNFSLIQNFVRGQLKDPYLSKEQGKIQVYNGTTVPGLAGAQADILTSYGYTITGTGNAPTKGYSQTIIVDLTAGAKKYTKNYLQQRYGVTAVTTLPDPTIVPNGADFVIIVGNDTSATR
ncbi:LCP family protein [Polaromonas sp.]|nr:LCP family protein [Candidatus Saccharibacteria bacterium]